MDDPLIVPLAKKYNKTPSQILLRWGLQKVSLLSRFGGCVSVFLTRRRRAL